MRAFVRFLFTLVALAAVVAGGAWFWAGRLPGPTIELRQPGNFIGQSTMLELMLEAPGGHFDAVEVVLEQGASSFEVFTLDRTEQATVTQDTAERIYVMRPVGAREFPELREGPARITVRASRPVVYGIRQASSSVVHEVQVRLQPPQVAVLSNFHFINHGGSEFVVYRATPEDVASGVRVGEITYPGFPASGVGIPTDPALRVAFFALVFAQDLDTPIQVFARDPAGNETLAPLDHRVIPKPYNTSRIGIDDRFIERVVPAIAANWPGEPIPTDDALAGFLHINNELRRKNNEFIAGLAQQTSPQIQFSTAFAQLGNSQVESRFADSRTYIYDGKEVDRQVHLGFDLAVTANVPIEAAQSGTVVYAADLGIYGNCVVIDHGLGVQSLYAHLSSIAVHVGDTVAKGGPIGRSGMTGLAGGDHLHFTMLVGGQQVTPVDWWSPQWFEDRVQRKIVAAGGMR
jgi:murein DD-endopeptidase MepM/ murein hydrolase activator NlpD